MGGREVLRRWWRRGRTAAPPPTFLRVAYTVAREVVLLTAGDGDEDNVWPVDWHVPLSTDPPLYGVALTPSTFGTSLIQRSGVFVVNVVPAEWEDAILLCGRTSGRSVDKFAATGLRRVPATAVAAQRLDGSLGHLECTVEQTVRTGDHVLVVGRVVHAALDESDGLRLHHHDRSVAAEDRP